MAYLVAVDASQPTWIRWDRASNLPRFTFNVPDPMTREQAQQLKQQAAIACGGTLRIVRVAASV